MPMSTSLNNGLSKSQQNGLHIKLCGVMGTDTKSNSYMKVISVKSGARAKTSFRLAEIVHAHHTTIL